VAADREDPPPVSPDDLLIEIRRSRQNTLDELIIGQRLIVRADINYSTHDLCPCHDHPSVEILVSVPKQNIATASMV
jgi:DNA repair protein RadC